MDQPIRNECLGRRLLVLRVAGLGAAATAGGTAEATAGLPGPASVAPALVETTPAASGPAASGPVEQVRTDNDPGDSPGQGRRGGGGGRTDNDPRDSPGYGRGYSGGYNAYAPQRRGATDNDPRDAAGGGRGYGYAPQQQRRSVTDNDPSDGQGRGRGWR